MIPGLLMTCLGFLSGSVLYSYHLPLWLKHVDVVKVSPDHNPGSVNAIRAAGVPLGLLCMALDILKGCWPVFVAWYVLRLDAPLLCPVMLAPVLGHALALPYPFKGGKAIAATFGVLIGLIPLSWAAAALAFWYVVFSAVIVIRPNERRSVIVFGCFMLTCVLTALLATQRWWLMFGCLAVACVPAYKNAADLRRAETVAARTAAEKR